MKKTRLTKLIASSLIAVSVLAISPIGASAEWRKDSKGWWYSEGYDSWSIGWRNIDGKYYYFDASGYMLASTVVDGNTLDSSGAVSKIGVGTLSKEDFNYVGTDITNSLKGYKNIIDWFNGTGYINGWGCYYVGKDSEFGKDSGQTTKGIKIGSSLNEVIAAYGNTEIKNVTLGDTFYMYADWKTNPEKKCVTYSYYEGIHKCNIRFYFDASDKLVVIAYTVNEREFPEGDLAKQLSNQYRAQINAQSK